MGFYTQKLLSSYLLPLPLCLTLILLGFLLAWKWKKAGLIIILVGWAGLLLYSLTPISNQITASLESHYQPLLVVPKGVHSIVVLGGGVRTNPHIAPANTQLGSSSLSRLIEGIRLYRQLKRRHRPAQLVLSGGSVFNSPKESGILRNTAVMLGVPRHDILLEGGSKNTHQEVRRLKQMLHKKRFILVTSATHMRRAMLLFKNAGMNPIPAPTQFLSTSRPTTKSRNFIPKAKSLSLGDLSLHEYLGIIWAKLKQQI